LAPLQDIDWWQQAIAHLRRSFFLIRLAEFHLPGLFLITWPVLIYRHEKTVVKIIKGMGIKSIGG
jgi:hypothetical protein